MQLSAPRLETCASDLVPVLHRPGRRDALALVHRHVHMGLAVERDGRTTPVSSDDYRRWGESPATLYPLALANLRRRGTQVGLPIGSTDTAVRVVAGTAVAASQVLLLPELMKPWPVEGVLVGMPSADQLLILPIDELRDLRALDTLVQATRELAEAADDPISGHLFWYDLDAWAVVPIVDDGAGPVIRPPAALQDAVLRLATLSLVGGPGVA